MSAIDLFAGAGGWDLAARQLGIEPLGIELDQDACATRDAAGFRTLQADVAALDPADFGPCELSVGSPPCPTFSRAGKGDGIADMPLVYEAAKMVAAETFRPGLLSWRDTRSELVVEPLRWALALRPTYLAWEQVPDVLPFWKFCASILRERGWSVWAGLLHAECWGVPQTRTRAILMASRNGPVEPPKPTHQHYVKGEPQRLEATLDGEVLPWVSIAGALGWEQEIDRPAPTVTAGGTASGGPEVFGSQGRKAIHAAMTFRRGSQENATERTAAEPAPTLAFGHDAARTEWTYNRPSPTITTTRRSDQGIIVGRQLPDGEGRNVGGWNWKEWGGEGPTPAERPATTVAGDPRLTSPNHHNHGEQSGNAIRVTLEEAAVLQSFPADFPFQGSKSARFTQVGNAIPPLLALAILSKLVGRDAAEPPTPEHAAAV